VRGEGDRSLRPKLILGISDEMSSRGDIERIRLVGRVVDDYNAHAADSGRKTT